MPLGYVGCSIKKQEVIIRRCHRLDANHHVIADALTAAGVSVQSMAGLGSGVPDLLCGYRGMTVLVEIKDGAKSPSRRRLTDDQLEWGSWWRGSPVYIISSVEEVLPLLNLLGGK